MECGYRRVYGWSFSRSLAWYHNGRCLSEPYSCDYRTGWWRYSLEYGANDHRQQDSACVVMGTTTAYALRYPELTDPPLVQQDIKNLASDVDGKIPGIPIGASGEWDYGAAQIPSWALLQYGQAISRTTYSALNALASAASYPHGTGDGSTTFNIADKRGRARVGKDDMVGTAANRITAAISGQAGTVLGTAVGNEGVTLAVAAIPSHNHTGATGGHSADHTHTGQSSGFSANHTHGIGDP